MNDSKKRINKLASLLESVPKRQIKTKKKLHKLVYLLQEAGLDFDHEFKFHHYGVFSPTLAGDLESQASLEVGAVFQQDSSGYDDGYIIGLSEDFESPEEESIESSYLGLIESLAGEHPRLLEALSTIVYLDRRYFKGDGLKSSLHELKPKLTSYYEKAYELAEKHYEITGLQ